MEISLQEVTSFKYSLPTPEQQAQARKDLQSSGIAIIENFFSQDFTRDLSLACQSKAAQAFFKAVENNVYLGPADHNVPIDHILNHMEPSRVGVLAYDQVNDLKELCQVYHDQDFQNIIASVLGIEKLYEYECPLGAINLTVMGAGDKLGWHFDLSDFVVSVPLQAANYGGDYEYCRNLRTSEDNNFEGVSKVIRGDRSQVEILEAAPGSLVIFEGRYTMHRVTEVQGPKLRLGVLFGFASEPGVTSSEYLRLARYGRTN